MKTLLTIFTLVFTVMFSSTSFAGWKKVTEHVHGNTFYVDFESIRKHDGYVYAWYLQNLLKPTPNGHLSAKAFYQVDCKIIRFKCLSAYFHKEPMGMGTGQVVPITGDSKSWQFPPPDTPEHIVIKSICAYAK